MTTVWKQRQAGETYPVTIDVTEQFGAPAMIVAAQPDWVKDPVTGDNRKVLSLIHTTDDSCRCKMCSEPLPAGTEIMVAEAEPGFEWFVASCPKCAQFIWAKLRKE